MPISIKQLLLCGLASIIAVSANADEASFTDEQLSVAEFWEQMGPTLREQGLDAYLPRYHDDFQYWDITGSGGLGTYDNAARAWTGFDEGGNEVACTHVIPVTVRVFGDHASARLVYEQADHLADGTTRYGIWRMVSLFVRNGDSWQVLDTNMVQVEPDQVTEGALVCGEEQ